jgi:glycosyltransferase involved in cell wall biosynthesis
MKLKKAAGKLPIAHGYVAQKKLKEVVRLQNDELIGLRQSVKRLEDRNDEWAAEVSELRGDGKKLEILWPVRPDDLIKATYWEKQIQPTVTRHKPPFTINWVIPPVGSISGGHAVIFRLVQFLESQGHICRLYVYDPMHVATVAEVKNNIKNHVKIKAELFYNEAAMKPCDAMFATGWTTAYPVYNYSGVAKKFYLLQDYEPMFEVSGTYSAITENTYKLGLHGIATSLYTADRTVREFGMQCDTIGLGINPKEYHLDNEGLRKKIIFYARPVTPRRGFELGILSLQLFHEKHPEYEINFIGWDTERYDIPFPYVNNKILSTEQLNELYNQSAACLALSFTSMSLLPIELMASGCIAVVNDAPFTRMVAYPEHVAYTEPAPQAIANTLTEIVENPAAQDRAKEAAAYATKFGWSQYNDQLEQVLIRELAS